MTCPSIDQLFDRERMIQNREHVARCDECRDLVDATLDVAAAIDSNSSGDCETAELLLAASASNPLDREDAGVLARHLAGCARCSLVAQSFLLEPASAPEVADNHKWAPAVVVRPTAKRTRWVLAGAALAAAALLLLVVFALREETSPAASKGDSDTARIGAGPSDGEVEKEAPKPKKKEEAPKKDVPKKEAPKKDVPKKEAPKKDVPKKEAPKKKDDTEAKAVANSPTDSVPAPGEVKRLKAELRASFANPPRAYAVCDRLIQLKVLSEVTKCAAVACMGRNSSKAHRYFRRLRSQSQKKQIQTLCKTKGIEL